jgi:hypothetical protein
MRGERESKRSKGRGGGLRTEPEEGDRRAIIVGAGREATVDTAITVVSNTVQQR